jgi:hypothetical protein
MTRPPERRRAWMLACASSAALAPGAPAFCQEDVAAQLKALRATVEAQAKELEAQRKALQTQSTQIDALKAAQPVEPEILSTFQGRGADPQAGSPPAAQAPASPAAKKKGVASADPAAQPAPAGQPPSTPVGEAPPQENSRSAVAAVNTSLPEQVGVLTRKGHWVVEPQLEYLHSSTNELVFRGVQIVPGLQVGLIDASTASRQTASGAMDVRYGLSSRSEIEVRVPYVYRHDTVETVAQQNQQVTETDTTANADIGDVEITGRYQINRVQDLAPIWIVALDVKTDTGLGPYSVPFDQFGVATKLATGSGFWALEPTVTVLYPSDPVVLYANIGWVANIDKNVDRQITSKILVGDVKPGDTALGAVGFAFALNDHFSFSLGYKHSYVFRTETQLNGTWQTSTGLTIGQWTYGMSYRINQFMTLSDNFEFGVTRDAPDVHVLTRLSFYF